MTKNKPQFRVISLDAAKTLKKGSKYVAVKGEVVINYPKAQFNE